jgi:hypothetical protein
VEQNNYQVNAPLEQTVITLIEQQVLVKRQSSHQSTSAQVPNYDGSKLVKKSSHKVKPLKKIKSEVTNIQAYGRAGVSLLANNSKHCDTIQNESDDVSDPTQRPMDQLTIHSHPPPLTHLSAQSQALLTVDAVREDGSVNLIPQMESCSDLSVVSSVKTALTADVKTTPVVSKKKTSSSPIRSNRKSPEQLQKESIFLQKKRKELDVLLQEQQKHRTELCQLWKQRLAEKQRVRQEQLVNKTEAQNNVLNQSLATKAIALNSSVGTIALNGFGAKNHFQNLNQLLPAANSSGVITLKLTNNNLQSKHFFKFLCINY